jgi:hypothetical protein
MQMVGIGWESALTGAVNLHFISLGTALVAALGAQLVPLHSSARARARTAAPVARMAPRAAPRPSHVNLSGRSVHTRKGIAVRPH